MYKEKIVKRVRLTKPGKLVRGVLAVSCLLVVTLVHAETVAGVVKKKVGTVEIVRDGARLSVDIGTRLQAGDVIRTSQNSGVGVTLKDETRMSLGADSQVVLEKFSFDPNTYAGSLLLNVNKGTFAMVSGLVAKNNPTAAQVRTPTATATVRTSSFAVEVP